MLVAKLTAVLSEIPRNRAGTERVEWEVLLDLLDKEDKCNPDDGKDHHRNGKLLPVHLLIAPGTAYPEDSTLLLA